MHQLLAASHPLPMFPPPPMPCRPPTIVKLGSVYPDAGIACLAAPTSGGTYSGFNCTVCRGSNCSQAPTCPNARRRSLLTSFCTSGVSCSLPGLESTTDYK